MTNVSLELYKSFFEVAKTKSMTKAANELLISQPAISKAIKTLENQLDVTLFNRSKKGLELTREGELLYARVKPAIELINNVENEITQFKKLEIGVINIGVSSVLTKCLLLDTLSTFKLKYPNIDINIINGLTSDLILKLNQGKLDFVIYNESNLDEKNVDSKFLTSLNYVFFYNSQYYEEIKINNLEDLNNYQLILQNEQSNTRKYLDKYTNNKLDANMEVVSQDLICYLVNNGLGIGFAFEKMVDIINPKLKKIRLKEIPQTNVFIALNKGIVPSFATKTFLKHLTTAYSND